MSQMTVLEVVQSVLSSMDSDNVNNINDTPESMQVAQVAKEVFFELLNYGDWPHLRKWMELESVSDTSRPNFLRIPTDVKTVEMFKYDATLTEATILDIKNVDYRNPEAFQEIVHSRRTDNTNVDIITNSNGVQMMILNDVAPTYWTTFDTEYIITDSYNNIEDTTLNGSKTSVVAYELPTWSSTNTYIPNFPVEFFPTYLAQVKGKCHAYFRQQSSPKDEQTARRGLSEKRRLQNRILESRFESPDWGRKG